MSASLQDHEKRIAALEQEIAALKARLEQTVNAVQDLSGDADVAVRNLKKRLSALEEK